VVVAAVALVAAAVPLLLPNGSFGAYGFNGAVYLGSSVHLVHGILPYRDYVFLQPPGISLLLSPLGALSLLTGTHAIWGLARLLMILVVATDCVLVALLLRRFGAAATLLGGLYLATCSVSGSVSTQVKLEPFLVAFVLGGALLLFREDHVATGWIAVFAGLLLGLAGLIKLWAAVPALVILAIILWRRRAAALGFVSGLLAGFVLPLLPFALLAPRAFLHEVLVTQQQRRASPAGASGVGHRLATLGYDALRALSPSLAVGAALGALLLLLLFASSLRRRRELSDLECFAAGSTLLSVGALLLAAESFTYYAWFPAAFLALWLGSATGEELARRRRLAQHSLPQRTPPAAGRAIGVLALCALGLLFLGVQVRTTRAALATTRPPGPSSVISSRVPAGACVVTNDAYTTLMADRLSSSRPGCRVVLDAEGLWLSLAPKSPPAASSSAPPAVVAAWRAALGTADYVVVNRYGDAYLPWTTELRAWFASRFELVGTAQELEVYRARIASPTG
jgi:hypothetical protein